MTMRWFSYILACVLLVGCHDTPRKNPFDPALTPAVELLDVQVDEKKGTATLTWTRYDGEMEFEAYRIQRAVSGMADPDTTFTVSSVSDTTFVDVTRRPDTEYMYQVLVRNTEGYENESKAYGSDPFSLRGVQLVSVDVDTLRGEARLVWTRYAGPGFESYRLERRITDMVRRDTLATKTDITDTSFVDKDVIPNVVYTYRVFVETEYGVEELSENVTQSYSIPRIRLSAEFDGGSASASLSWTRFNGPGFLSYEVERRIVVANDRISRVVHTSNDPSEVSCTDRNLDGAIEYSYTVTLVMAVHDSLFRTTSNEVKGGFYIPLMEWRVAPTTTPPGIPVAMELGKEDDLYVLTVFSPTNRLLLRKFDSSGSLLNERTVGDLTSRWGGGIAVGEDGVGLAADSEGNVYSAWRSTNAKMLTLAKFDRGITQESWVKTISEWEPSPLIGLIILKSDTLTKNPVHNG